VPVSETGGAERGDRENHAQQFPFGIFGTIWHFAYANYFPLIFNGLTAGFGVLAFRHAFLTKNLKLRLKLRHALL
jgi:hypothetical protein